MFPLATVCGAGGNSEGLPSPYTRFTHVPGAMRAFAHVRGVVSMPAAGPLTPLPTTARVGVDAMAPLTPFAAAAAVLAAGLEGVGLLGLGLAMLQPVREQRSTGDVC